MIVVQGVFFFSLVWTLWRLNICLSAFINKCAVNLGLITWIKQHKQMITNRKSKIQTTGTFLLNHLQWPCVKTAQEVFAPVLDNKILFYWYCTIIFILLPNPHLQMRYYLLWLISSHFKNKQIKTMSIFVIFDAVRRKKRQFG